LAVLQVHYKLLLLVMNCSLSLDRWWLRIEICITSVIHAGLLCQLGKVWDLGSV